ncbi:MAG TPA: hypothetical protein VIL12_06005 [Acidimicrobiia bacterium]
MPVVDGASGFGIGLLLAALLLGLRHGVDWDHIAAITDITATQDEPRRGAYLGTVYALGHAGVVFVIGVAAIALGRTLPPWLDEVMGRVVGWTLIVLGLYVAYSILRHGAGFRMQSRWMLLFSGISRGYRWARRALARGTSTSIEHEHEHAAVGDIHHDHDVAGSEGSETRLRAPTHAHLHRHEDDRLANYGPGAALGVGMLHGIGAETPTQVVVFLAATQAGGTAAGIAVLSVFLLGLLASNTVITIGSAFGLTATGRRTKVKLLLGAATAVVSLIVGTAFLMGSDALLPAFFAG